MSQIGIIAAFPGEIKALVRGWRRSDAVWQGHIGETKCVAVAAGMGSRAAERGCDLAESAAGTLDALVSLGWAGALSCGIAVARAYPVAEVVDSETGERFATSLPPSSGVPLTLVTIGHVAQAQEKRRLAEHYHAVLADMEAAAVARVARRKGIAFYCLKAASDSANELLPDFSRYADAAGKLRMAPLLAHVALRPEYWRPMARMGKNSRMGAIALAQAMNELFLSG